jgi:hypothetical protein
MDKKCKTDCGKGGKVNLASVKSTTMEHYKKVQGGTGYDDKGNPKKTTQVSKGLSGAGNANTDAAKKLPKYTATSQEWAKKGSGGVSKKLNKRPKG